MTHRFSKRALLALPLLGALALGACDDDPVAVEDEHHEPEGLVITMSGQQVATYDPASGWTGELDVAAGEETPHLDVTFVDEDGVPLDLEDDVYLEVDITDEAVAEFEQDTPGEFGGHLHGVAVGETDAVFKLMHGAVGQGHADFVTTEVHVHVRAP
jgi:hypothetical protein